MSSSLWGILAIALGLVVSVALHELGHFVPAKKFGALVPDFAIGFGPAIWKKERGGTTYAVRALPLGGYVRILGMFAPGSPKRKKTRRNGAPTLAEEARIASREELSEGFEHRAFYLLPWWKKLIVMVAGPATNLALALIIAMLAMMGIGSPAPSLTIDSVAPRITASTGDQQSPADAAGLKAGDTITAVNGETLTDWADFQQRVASSNGAPLRVSYLRDGVDATVTLQAQQSAEGTFLVGVLAGVEYQRATFAQTLTAYGQTATATVSAIVRLPVAAWDVTLGLLTGAQRDPDGLVSIVGVGRIAGEVTGDSAQLGIVGLRQQIAIILSLLASLNMALGLFNLIPLPPLDGGHIAGALVEGLKAAYARARGIEDPQHVDTAALMPLTWTVAALLIGLTVILVVADIVSPVTLR